MFFISTLVLIFILKGSDIIKRVGGIKTGSAAWFSILCAVFCNFLHAGRRSQHARRNGSLLILNSINISKLIRSIKY